MNSPKTQANDAVLDILKNLVADSLKVRPVTVQGISGESTNFNRGNQRKIVRSTSLLVCSHNDRFNDTYFLY